MGRKMRWAMMRFKNVSVGLIDLTQTCNIACFCAALRDLYDLCVGCRFTIYKDAGFVRCSRRESSLVAFCVL